MLLKKRKSISRLMFIGMFFFSAISTASVGLIWVVQEYDQFKKDSDKLRNEYVEGQKRLLKKEVLRAVEHVEYRIKQTEIRLEDSIKNRVYESYEIASNLYNRFHKSKSKSELKQMIIEALRNVRFNRGRGYYFAADFNAVIQLFGDHPELEGQDLSDMQDSQGKYVIRDLIKMVKNSKEGFYQYFWTKPDTDGNHHIKVAFVKHFEPFDWYIGTGEYLEDVRNEIQNEVLQRLIKIRFDTSGYLFGSTYDGKPLFTNGKITKGSASVWDLTDPNGIKIIQEQRKAVNNPEGAYYRYSWKKLSSQDPSPKFSFSKGVSEWKWMIGAGVYIDEIDNVIALKRANLNRQIRNQLIKVLITFLILILISYIFAKYISVKIQKIFDKFLTFFNKASSEYVQIDSSEMMFDEFSEIAGLANRVILDRVKSELALSKSELLLKMIAANYPCYISVINSEFTVTYASGKEFAKQNLDPVSFEGRSIEDIFGRKTEFIIDQCKKAFNGEEVHFELTFNNQNQLYALIPLFSDNESIHQILSIVENVTEKKQAEKALKRSEALIIQTDKMMSVGRLAAGMAHEINNPLGGMLQGVQNVQRRLSPDLKANDQLSQEAGIDLHNVEKYMEKRGILSQLDGIRKSGIKATQIISNMLQFSRQSESRIAPIDLVDLMENVLDLAGKNYDLKKGYDFRSIDVKKEYETNMPLVHCTETEIEQVLLNLLSNATWAMAEREDDIPAQITLRIKTEKKMIRIEVEDNGPGMDEKTKAQLFEPFFTTKAVGEGTGLGLSVSYMIITNNHHGTMEVISEPGKGARFVVKLPLESVDR